MPKLSVYVPDDLWERAKGADPRKDEKTNNSQLVQHALEQMLNERQARTDALGAGAARDEARFASVVAGLRDDASREYENGYNAALELIEIQGYSGLGLMIDIGELAPMIRGGAISGEDDEHVAGWLKRHGWVWDEDDMHATSFELFRTGAQQAVDDVWQALLANPPGTTASADEVQDDATSAEAQE